MIYWSSGRLAKMYDSVFIAELKAANNSLVEWMKIREDIARAFPGLKTILFSDNKAMTNILSSDKKVHPFASSYADFCRQVVKEHEVEVRWCPAASNLADKLTKPQKW